mmetsp:Transcript_45868/g.127871  ORF Transcript_45868/g.127871 Transcript_45868/m.127871 type:complete len:266 (+) Transcript_45868:90-887(+)
MPLASSAGGAAPAAGLPQTSPPPELASTALVGTLAPPPSFGEPPWATTSPALLPPTTGGVPPAHPPPWLPARPPSSLTSATLAAGSEAGRRCAAMSKRCHSSQNPAGTSEGHSPLAMSSVSSDGNSGAPVNTSANRVKTRAANLAPMSSTSNCDVGKARSNDWIPRTTLPINVLHAPRYSSDAAGKTSSAIRDMSSAAPRRQPKPRGVGRPPSPSPGRFADNAPSTVLATSSRDVSESRRNIRSWTLRWQISAQEGRRALTKSNK